jgi:hypothetical protein
VSCVRAKLLVYLVLFIKSYLLEFRCLVLLVVHVREVQRGEERGGEERRGAERGGAEMRLEERGGAQRSIEERGGYASNTYLEMIEASIKVRREPCKTPPCRWEVRES